MSGGLRCGKLARPRAGALAAQLCLPGLCIQLGADCHCNAAARAPAGVLTSRGWWWCRGGPHTHPGRTAGGKERMGSSGCSASKAACMLGAGHREVATEHRRGALTGGCWREGRCRKVCPHGPAGSGPPLTLTWNSSYASTPPVTPMSYPGRHKRRQRNWPSAHA